MARLTRPVPRGRRGVQLGVTRGLNPLHPGSIAYGYYGVGETRGPTQTVAEKLAPGPKATKAAAHTPPPKHSGGTSGDLTVPGYEPATPTGAPYDPNEPGTSAADFAAAIAARERRRAAAALRGLAPLAAPSPHLIGQPLALHNLQRALAPGLAEEAGLSTYQADVAGHALLNRLPAVPQPSAPHATDVAYRQPPGPVEIPIHGLDGGKTLGISRQAIRANPQDPLGALTLGNASVAQLRAASQAGTLRFHKGVFSTPGNRNVLQRLLAAHAAYQQSRTLGPVKSTGTLSPEEIGTLLVQEGRRLGLHLTPHDVAEGVGVAEAESAGNSQEQRQLADFSDPEDAHIGLFAEEGNGFNLGVDERLNPRLATRGALERFAADQRSWNPAWVHWQEVQGENETGADRAPEYEALARELLKGGQNVDPKAVENLVNAKHAAVEHGINPTPWNGDVQGGGSDYVWIRADAKGAIDWARSTLGTQEGSPRQRHWAELEALGPSEPWCADWVAVNLARRGVPLPEGPNGSWNYEDPGWKGGTQLGTDIAKAKPGDLIVYGGGAHIAMYVGDGKVIAGNWGDEVAEYGATEDSRGISAIVRPHYKGGKVKVKAGQLPGSSSEGTFGGGGETVGGAVPAAAAETVGGGGTTTEAQRQAGEAALASFGAVPGSTGLAPNLESLEDPGEAQQLFELLARASNRVNRA